MRRFQIFTPSDEYGNLDLTDFEDSAKKANAINGNLVATQINDQTTDVIKTVGIQNDNKDESFFEKVEDKIKEGFDEIKNGVEYIYGDAKSGVETVYDTAKGGVSSVYEDVKGGVTDVYETGSNVVEGLEYGAIAIGVLLAWGISKSFSQSDVNNVGKGVSRVVKSAK